MLRIISNNFIKYLKKTRYEIIHKPIKNYYNTRYKNKALLSYIVTPFKNDSLSHTNYYEANSWAKILHELGYTVDIIQFDGNTTVLNLSEYDLICGFGDVFQKSFEMVNFKAKTIYYGAGMHVCHQNNATLERVKEVYSKKGAWLGKSARFVKKSWTHQTSLVNGIIALGNNTCAESYRKYYNEKVFSIEAPFYKVHNIEQINRVRMEKSKKNFLWFGSSGLIHKGLDLLLEYFSQNKDINLYICGPVLHEKEFVSIYNKELFKMKNIILYGFIDINSKLFVEILSTCSFVIMPSCSEGGAPSVLTAIGNGGLIPLVSKETAISTGNEIIIDSLSYSGIDKAISKALSLNYDEIINLQIKNYNYVNLNNSQESYYKQLKASIKEILG